MRKKRRQKFSASKEPPVNIDVLAENVKIPFASFVDQKMIKDGRRVEIINCNLDKEIVSIQKKYELQKNAFIAKFSHRAMKRNSYVDINSRSMKQSTVTEKSYEGPVAYSA